jgi:glyoxalase family protein
MNKRSIKGIHHVTSMSGPAQQNVDFYVAELGLRLVKRTVNFDDPGTYHLYYGDGAGTPGSIMTFFPWANAAPGRTGRGATESTGFTVAAGSLGFWKERLTARGWAPEEIAVPNGSALRFADPDGMIVEISESRSDPDSDSDSGSGAGGAGLAGIDGAVGISSFSGVLLDVPEPERTAEFLTDVFGYESEGEAEGRLRFRSPSGAPGSVVDLRSTPSSQEARMGRGSVHHVAFRTSDDADQLHWRETVRAAGIAVTGVMDRNYFHSVYFREPGGVLFEIATDPPGFSWDETEEDMGTELKLPPWLESRRSEISASLPDLVDPSRHAKEATS